MSLDEMRGSKIFDTKLAETFDNDVMPILDT